MADGPWHAEWTFINTSGVTTGTVDHTRYFDIRTAKFKAADKSLRDPARGGTAERGSPWKLLERTKRGEHRSAGAVDLVVAATAELQGLTLLHRDRDFACIATVTGQARQWYGPEPGK
ncbi:hypothetical protein PV419_22850 [Streptomyces sp. ME19-01-6]|nr:hypothetical protein [Streptomyces sp. ME19-01-6]MDX3228439.1 hypothetical protein [Streptomyces sp. ME19-01-6]